MQVQLILTALTPKDAAQLCSLTSLISDTIASQDTDAVRPQLAAVTESTPAKAEKKERKAKKEKSEPLAIAADDDDDDLMKDLEGDSAAEIDLGDDDDDDLIGEKEPKPAPEKKKAPKLSLESDIIPAFVAFAKKHDRKAAADILAKYGVKSVRELPTDSFEKVLKKLSA